MNVRWLTAPCFIAPLLLAPLAAHAARSCLPDGSYGYVYNGTSYTPTTNIALAETGYLSFDKDAGVSGVGTLVFQFVDFNGTGPLWLSLREVQSNGTVTPDPTYPCGGSVAFLATATVLQSSNPAVVPVGTVLFSNSPRSISYAITGSAHQDVKIIATSPGTVASGSARRLEK